MHDFSHVLNVYCYPKLKYLFLKSCFIPHLFVFLQLHLPDAAVMSSVDDGKLRINERRRKDSFCMPSESRFDRKANRWVEHYILKGVTDALFLVVSKLRNF